MDLGYEDGFAPARVAVLLKEFAQLDDDREPWRVMYPLAEVLLSVTCATVSSCDDVDDIVAFGEHHLHDLRRYAPFHHGVPCARWIRALVNRVDPVLFAACFESWIKAMWPDRHDLIAIVLRRAHDEGQDRAAHARRAQGPQGPAHAERLCRQRPPGARPGERAREGGRDHRDPGPARPPGPGRPPQRGARHHRPSTGSG